MGKLILMCLQCKLECLINKEDSTCMGDVFLESCNSYCTDKINVKFERKIITINCTV